MLRNQQLLNVVANTPHDAAVTLELNGTNYPLEAVEVRNGTLVLSGGAPAPKATGKKPAPAKAADAGEGMELK